MTAVEPLPIPQPIDARRAESRATQLCNLLMDYCAHIGLSAPTLAARTGVSIWTIRGLRHKKVKNYPQLLTFVKLLAAADLEITIVRASQGLDLTPDNDPSPPPTYNTGTEGNVQWRPAP